MSVRPPKSIKLLSFLKENLTQKRLIKSMFHLNGIKIRKLGESIFLLTKLFRVNVLTVIFEGGGDVVSSKV